MGNLIFNIQDFFNYDFLFYALVGTTFLSLSCGLFSPLIIARGHAFMGSALSHSTLLGMSIAMAFASETSTTTILLLTYLITLFFTFFLAWGTLKQKLPPDSMIGIFFTSSMGLGIIIHNMTSNGSGNLLDILFGNILLLDSQDISLFVCVFFIIILGVLIPFKKWLYIINDFNGAKISGLNVRFYHFFFFFLLTTLIVTSLKLAGTVLVNTLLLVPGFFGLTHGRTVKQVFIYSTIFSLFFSITGLIFANFFNLPSGATLAVVQFSGLMLSIALKWIYQKQR